MDKPLADWVNRLLSRPGWQLLVVQWLILLGIVLFVITWSVSGEWQQLVYLQEQQQRIELQIAERQQQLNQLPARGELEQRLRQKRSEQPGAQSDFGHHLYQVGGVLLRWQQQADPAQQRVKLQIEFNGLLRLLAGISPTKRIGRISIEQQPEGLITQLTLLASGDMTNE